MNVTQTITPEDAGILLGKYIGNDITLIHLNATTEVSSIGGLIIKWAQAKGIKGFKIHLRMLEEATEEEKLQIMKLATKTNEANFFNQMEVQYHHTFASMDYCRKIGLTNNPQDLETYIIR